MVKHLVAHFPEGAILCASSPQSVRGAKKQPKGNDKILANHTEKAECWDATRWNFLQAGMKAFLAFTTFGLEMGGLSNTDRYNTVHKDVVVLAYGDIIRAA